MKTGHLILRLMDAMFNTLIVCSIHRELMHLVIPETATNLILTLQAKKTAFFKQTAIDTSQVNTKY